MPEATTTPPNQATRIAGAVGRGLCRGSSPDDEGVFVLSALDDSARAHAGTKDALLFHPGSDPRGIKQIVIVLDGTSSAESIIPYAVQIAEAEAATVQLILPERSTYELTGTPSNQYLNVLVNTMREQHLQVNGELTSEDLLAAAGKVAKAGDAMVALSATGNAGIKDWVFGAESEKKLLGAPVLIHCPY